MNTDQPGPEPVTASQLCTRIAQRLEHDSTDIVAYGAGPNDAVLAGGEHTTTVLSVAGGTSRWYRVTVQEFFPDSDDPVWLDYPVMAALARRAGVEEPRFRFGPLA